MPKLKMSPGHKVPIFSDEKTITVRDGKREEFVAGEIMEIVSSDEMWGCKATITKVTHTSYEGMEKKDYEDDGFESRRDMTRGMKKYYPKIGPFSSCTVIRWENVTDTWEKEK